MIPVRHISASSKEPGLTNLFSIRNLSVLLSDKDMVQELHRHDFFYVLVLNKAAGQHVIDFVPHTITGPEGYFMRPGQVHQLELAKGSTGFLIQFSTEFYFPKNSTAHLLLRTASSSNHYPLNAANFNKLESFLNHIEREYLEKGERYEEAIMAAMNIFFIELLRLKKVNVPEKANLYNQERLDQFRELLETNIFTHKQVSEYAEMLHLSVYQLNAIAKAALGKTCSELINDQIILEAKRCLLATSRQVNQTAYRLGYEDVSYFIRFFKKQTGYSPEAFRNQYQ